jgi:hypothetical protein
MSLNHNITNATYFLITWKTYNEAPVPQAILDNYEGKNGIWFPASSEDEEPIRVTTENATMRQAIEAANTRHVDPAVPLVVTPGEKPVEVGPDESPTHAFIGMRQVGGSIDVVAMGIAQAEGRPYEQVKLSQEQASHFRNTGELPA